MNRLEMSKNQKGFTLIEVLVSFVLLTVVISLVLSLLPNMGNMNKKNEDSLEAANVGKEILLKYKNQKLDRLTDLSNPLIVKENYKNFNIIITITPEPDISGPKQNLHKIKVEITKSDLVLSTTYGYMKR